MKILVLNSGSSSIKYKLFDSKKLNLLFEGIQEEVTDFHSSFTEIFDNLINSKIISSLNDIAGFGHRVVHGGECFSKPTIINKEVLKQLKKLIDLAPLHNPSNIDGIEIIQNKIPKARQIAVFDTAFHTSLPIESYLYPIPYSLYENHKIRKYGFHGTSHYYVAKQYALNFKKNLKELNLITVHLGNGASICAIKNGKSIDTSMGFTPLEGLTMGTRSGDIDPAIIIYLQQDLNYTTQQIDTLLNKQSGLKGICNESDLRKILELKKQNNNQAKIAINIFVEKIRKYLGAYIVKLAKVDGIIFTGGIGENSSIIRKKICKDLFYSTGIILDTLRNKQKHSKNFHLISSKNSKVKLAVVKTNEEKEIATQTKKILKL